MSNIIDTQTSTGTELEFDIPSAGTYEVRGTLGTETVSKKVEIKERGTYRTQLKFTSVYGVTWDKSSSTTLTRTDDASEFSDPNPYYSGMLGTPSSPFDNLMPWAGMKIVTRDDGNVLVEIPKFWYKITNTSSSLSFQIADGPNEGFLVAPAFRDIGSGEYDYAYVGRYHCSSASDSAYKSVSGVRPRKGITRNTARTQVSKLGTGYNQFDFAMYWTICMLYIVEFANWNSQACIGYGCGNNSDLGNCGYTDSMPYHTGTTKTSRTTYGYGTQYRYIEGLWDNVFDFVDGITFNGSNVLAFLNPSQYSDSSSATGAVLIGTRNSSSVGYIKDYFQPSVSGFEWALYASSVQSSGTSYIPDYSSYDSSGVVLRCGGGWEQSQSAGIFSFYGAGTSSYSASFVGCRLLWRPS